VEKEFGAEQADAFKGMWAKSKPSEYTAFRTFIMGITSQSMFPNGVIYEGVSEKPLSFRGESGANDSMVGFQSHFQTSSSIFTSPVVLNHLLPILLPLLTFQIPLLDNLLQIAMPSTPLTTILHDFRSYRPGNHRAFLSHVASLSSSLSFKSYALASATSTLLYLKLLDQVRDFRYRHWCFTREYILKRTAHPTATGGSPIVTWLPNQLVAVLDAMNEVGEMWGTGMVGKAKEEVGEMMEVVERQREGLKKEVERWCAERGVV
jgi:indoleamine 2,3-dioxygenase